MVARLGGFSAAAILPVVSSFVLFPVIARSSSAGEWVAVAIGQSVGLVGATLVNLGWSVLGPAEVAAMDRGARDKRYVDSLVSRLVAWCLVAPLAALVAFELAPSDGHVVGAALAVAFSASGLSPRWFTVAEADPRRMIVWDVLPVVGSNLVAGVAILAGAPLLTFPVLLTLTSLTTAVLFPVGHGSRRADLARIASAFRGRLPATFGEFVASSYSTATVALVSSQAAASAMPQYASGFRLYTWGLLALVAVTNSLQAWAADPHADRGSRFRALLKIHLGLGLVGLVGLAVAGPTASKILFGSDLATSTLVCLGLGLSYFAVALTTTFARHILVIEQRISIAIRCVVAGCVIGIPLTLVLTHLYGVAGGAFGLAISEAMVLVFAAPTALSVMASYRSPSPTTPTSSAPEKELR